MIEKRDIINIYFSKIKSKIFEIFTTKKKVWRKVGQNQKKELFLPEP